MHRNFENCVVKVLLLTLLTLVSVSGFSLNGTKVLIDENTIIFPKVGSVIEVTNHLLDEMNSTLNAQYFLITNSTRKLYYTLPDPWTIEEIQPKLIFYRNGYPDLHLSYKMNATEMAKMLHSKGYLDTNRLIFITHGFHNNFNASWLTSFKNSILNVSRTMKLEQTVAIIGWGGGADLLVFRYRQAAANVITVGRWLAAITKAIKDIEIKLSIYGIGHSLGAHVMGVAGRISNAFDRITGLDPAGPCFEKVNNSQTLISSDAPFVDIIHTDGYDSKLDPAEWIFPVNHYGSLVPIGSIDFYPNFGYHQPNAGTFTVAGSHLRALDLFQWSIENPGKFMTSSILSSIPDYNNPVDEWTPSRLTVEMGYYADVYKNVIPSTNWSDSSTLFFIKTNGEIPWI